MKTQQLRQIIREEVTKVLNEDYKIDEINNRLNLLDKAADMVIKDPQSNVVEFANNMKKYTQGIRNNVQSIKNEFINDPLAVYYKINEINSGLFYIDKAADMVIDPQSNVVELVKNIKKYTQGIRNNVQYIKNELDSRPYGGAFRYSFNR